MTTDLVIEDKYDLTTEDGKTGLAKAMLNLPQCPCPVIHRFGPGVYIREASYPKGSIIIGQKHVGEHINMLLKGKINVFDGTGNVLTLEAPHMFVAPPGSKIGYALEDVVWQNIYATTETDIEKIEATIFEAPEFFNEYNDQKVLNNIDAHKEDREDFNLMLEQTGWSALDIERISHNRKDCISFPYGNYSLAPGESSISGKGLFATSYIRKGQVIAPMRLDGKRTPAGYLVNHSKNPNTKAEINNKGNMYLVALKGIQGMFGGQLGEELTLDYRQVMLINNLWDGEIKCQEL
jgi:hypothetical protein